MTSINALSFLKEILAKRKINFNQIPFNDFATSILDNEVKKVLSNITSLPQRKIVLNDLKSKVLYDYTDEFGISFLFFTTSTERKNIFVVGPYLTITPTSARLLEIGELLQIPPKKQQLFEQLFLSIPVISRLSCLFTIITTICEKLYATTDIPTISLNEERTVSVPPITQTLIGNEPEDILLDIKTMEQRYVFENQLMRAVSLGQINKATELLASVSESLFEQRVADPIRNVKNYDIIINTLFRKAAENGGVHPIYIDKISSRFARQIELIKDVRQNAKLMIEMFRAYCNLVREHSLKNFSPIVQKTILLIDSDLSADLTTKTLADAQSVSLGYLSAIFRKETHKTISQFVREKRVNYAIHLLTTTSLQIQTIALHCGVMDAQYFTKIFKSLTGKTPSQYRDN